MDIVGEGVRTAEIDIVGFMPTPFTEADEIDEPKMSKLAAIIASQGIRPAVLGGMGEFYALNREEARSCMEAAVSGAGETPVVAGIGFSTREAVELAQDAKNAGISILVVNPHYYEVPTPHGLAEHVRRLTESSGLPAVMYSSVSHPITEAHIDRLVGVPGFRGVKEEAYGPKVMSRRLEQWGHRVEWWAVGEVGGVEYVRAGASVITSSLANVSPVASTLCVRELLGPETTEHSQALDFAAAWNLYLSQAPEGIPGALKSMMQELYGWRDAVRAPMSPPGPETCRAARGILKQFGNFLASPNDSKDKVTSTARPNSVHGSASNPPETAGA